MQDYTIYKRLNSVEKELDELTEAVHTLKQELEEALKEIKELKYRVMEDDCR